MDPVDMPVPPPHRVAPARGLEWITQAWAPFVAAPGQWIALTLLLFVAMLVCQAMPVLGNLLAPFVCSVFAAGTLLAMRSARQASTTTLLSDVFAILSHESLQSVLIVAGITLGMTLAVGFVSVLLLLGIGGASVITNLVHGTPVALVGGAFALLLAMLVSLLALVPITAMYWYALPDVVFAGTDPWTAMRRSLSACLHNVVPLLLYGVLMLTLLLIAMIPLGLGLLVMIPLLLNSWLISYEDIYAAPRHGPG